MESYIRSVLPRVKMVRAPSSEELLKVSGILSCLSIQDLTEEETRLTEQIMDLKHHFHTQQLNQDDTNDRLMALYSSLVHGDSKLEQIR